MRAHFGDLKGRSIAIWGLAFKPKTDDMREAPAITIIEELLDSGASVAAYDPEAARTARGIFGDRIQICEKSYDALAGADGLAVVTEWNEFREPDLREDAPALEAAGRVRRAQHLLARADARARILVFLHWPLIPAGSW